MYTWYNAKDIFPKYSTADHTRQQESCGVGEVVLVAKCQVIPMAALEIIDNWITSSVANYVN